MPSAVDALLAGEAPFTAVCAANDLLALGALQRLAELGIDVPGEVSVAGFDDIPTAAMATPGLSTVRLPLHEIGRRAFGFAERRAGRRRARRPRCSRPSSSCAGRPAAAGRRGPPVRDARRPGRGAADGRTRWPAGSSWSPAAAAGSARRSRSRPPPRAPPWRSTTTARADGAERDARPGPRRPAPTARCFAADLADGAPGGAARRAR